MRDPLGRAVIPPRLPGVLRAIRIWVDGLLEGHQTLESLEELAGVLIIHNMSDISLSNSVTTRAFVNTSSSTTHRPWEIPDTELEIFVICFQIEPNIGSGFHELIIRVSTQGVSGPLIN